MNQLDRWTNAAHGVPHRRPRKAELVIDLAHYRSQGISQPDCLSAIAQTPLPRTNGSHPKFALHRPRILGNHQIRSGFDARPRGKGEIHCTSDFPAIEQDRKISRVVNLKKLRGNRFVRLIVVNLVDDEGRPLGTSW